MVSLDSPNSYQVHGLHYKTGDEVIIDITDGSIQDIQACPTSDQQDNLPIIAPGLVDLQINGYLGMDFNQSPLLEETVTKITYTLVKVGVTSYYPTIITNSSEAIEQAMSAIANACHQDEMVNSVIAGIHLEGPFISPEDGPRGAHDAQYVMAPDWNLFSSWQAAADGKIKIVTLSPEWDGTDAFIKKCKEHGVTVSIGHTAASAEQINSAADAGARLSTHLGNGAHVMLPRHPNYIWEQLANDKLYACMIADGFHLPASVLKVFLRAKQEKAMIVSDKVSLCGMEPGEYSLHIGGKVILTETGKLHLADNPRLLAGSASKLIQGIQFLVNRKITTFAGAWDMASVRPAAFMQLEDSTFQIGSRADVVLFTERDGNIDIKQTIKKGKLVYEAD
ncbi:N-acetylglucosamine-6-phosphate deacetylase [Radiobacillus sp. PE A8.2]|uniref:N-acetylglucosamine-6-phosphate deacetylase n=1 Tax=Radiobacillus sp. PE A8.2 TaxID=3380349 RepID=UPI003890F640